MHLSDLPQFLSKALFLLCVVSLSACMSSEKKPYDSALNQQKDSSKKEISKRDISYLKELSHLDGNNFEFVRGQMQTVIQNYMKMKEQLVKIEDKLDTLLNQWSLKKFSGKENVSDHEEVLDIPESSEESVTQTLPQLLDEELTDETQIFPEEEEAKIKASPEIKEDKDKKGSSETPSQTSARKEKPNSSLIPSLKEAKKLFRKKAYESAISRFQSYREQNPEGTHYPEATYYIGQSFKQLKMPIEAQVFFQEIVQSHPGSLWARLAKENLKE